MESSGAPLIDAGISQDREAQNCFAWGPKGGTRGQRSTYKKREVVFFFNFFFFLICNYYYYYYYYCTRIILSVVLYMDAHRSAVGGLTA
jgi:hypothetical protein